MTLNYLAIVVVTIIAFVIAGIWHGPLFGKTWAKIHGMDTLSKKEQQEKMKGMWKIMTLEFITTLLMVFSLACLIVAIPEYSGVRIALMSWIGFIVPMTVSNIIWGGDKSEYQMQKILITIGVRLIMFLCAGYILSIW